MKLTFEKIAARTAVGCGAAVLTLACGTSQAEDIDIYSAAAASGDMPNVLIVLDNAANWDSNLIHNCGYKDNLVPTGTGPDEGSSRVGMEKCALHNVIDALPVRPDGSARYNVGLMMYSSSNSPEGGYPRIAFTEVSRDNKGTLKTAIKSLAKSDKSNNSPFAETLNEAYRYYAGMSPMSGRSDKDPFDANAFSGAAYNSPSAGSCGRNYIIYIGNGKDPSSNSSKSVEAMLKALGGDTTPISYVMPVKNYGANWADEYARFMSSADVSNKDGGQFITTYTVMVPDAKNDGEEIKNQQLENFMAGVAHHGGGKYFRAASADALVESLLSIFEEVAEVDSAFVSASLPVSVNSRGTYLNQVFMGLFRPDGSAAPRWRGNLKQYQFNYDRLTDSLHLADASGQSAISSGTGFFTPGAVSHWTEDSAFWVNQQMGTPPTASDRPDGEVVEKGGAAQRLRAKFPDSLADRKVYTCIGCSAGAILSGAGTATKFDVANTDITAGALGTTSDADRNALIDWVRGADNAGDEHGPGDSAIRPSVHGDVLHSRPVVVNYGGSIGVVVYYGANDGMLHAVNGNQTGTDSGSAYWSFVPEEGFPKLKRLRDNTPNVRFSTTPDALTSPLPRDYFFDGPLSFYQKVGSGGATEKVYLFAGMRRGGRALYAFDVTDPTAPEFMWKATNADIPILGQTWSEAKVGRVKGYTNPVVVMGAGYDAAAEDVEPQGAATMGKAVLVLDAVTGELLAQFETNRPVVADVSLLDSDYDGFIDRGYVGDLGGTVYRIDFERGDTNGKATWAMTTFANLGSSGSRKMFYPPDVVLTRDFAVVMIGTGDREKPLETVTNERFFTLIDTENQKGVSADFAAIDYGELVAQSALTSPGTQRGCFMTMAPDGEKIVNAPVTAGGMTYFSTNRPTRPTGNSCTNNLGEAKVYGVPIICQEATSQVLIGGGLPPSPVTGNVAINLGKDGDGNDIVRRVPFIIGGFNVKRSGIEGSKVQIAVPPQRTRLYWFNETDR